MDNSIKNYLHQINSINKPKKNYNIKFGTPLFLSTGEENNKEIGFNHLPAHKQIVKDENGKRRFHGAFTGGFSAGYNNTVGSEEGFIPKSFKSSRNVKKKKNA